MPKLLPCSITLLLAAAILTPLESAERLPLSELLVFNGEHPRAVHFRMMERPGAKSYEEWEDNFDGLMGFIGQALPDQLSDHVDGIEPKVAEYYQHFKKNHPDQIVLLHVNGLSQGPKLRTMDDFPGHWLYFEGAKIIDDLPATAGNATIKVADHKPFNIKTGFRKCRSDHIGLCELDSSGKPDWRRAEYVRLLSIDAKQSTLTVQRAQFGSVPLALKADRSYAAAIVTHGPWNDEKGDLEWEYNFSTLCPRDGKGRNAGDMYVEYFTKAMKPGGILDRIDGVAFDVMYLTPQVLDGRLPDFNADGKGDDYEHDTTYMTGQYEFYRKLHEALGGTRILTSDVQEFDNQRALGILNGGESENWLTHNDPETRFWSSGMNRNLFWEAFARRPTFNYLNHKFSPPNVPQPEKIKQPFQPIPYHQHRLKIASAVLCGQVVTSRPPAAPGAKNSIGMWDELVCGSDQKRAWLGKATGPMQRLALKSDDLLAGKGTRPDTLLPLLHGDGVRFIPDNGTIRVEATGTGDLRFELRGIPLDGPDLTLFATLHADGRKGFPPEHARMLFASAGAKNVPHPGLGREKDRPDNREYALVNDRDFQSVFYFKNLQGNTADIEFCIESSEPLWIGGLSAHAEPDAIVRGFEHGAVLANPAPHPYTVDLSRLFPGTSFRRIAGTAKQDPQTNNGQPVGNTVELPALDALFLVREK